MPGDIFYSEVDQNLQDELRHRAASGFNRTERDLHFQLDKVANVSLAAYTGNDRTDLDTTSFIGPVVLSGQDEESPGFGFPRPTFLPSGPSGYLNENAEIRTQTITEDVDISGFQIEQNDGKITVSGESKITSGSLNNIAQRVPPFITAVSITIADSSQAKLNRAEVQLSIPNADLDLERIERLYFRPGRLVQLKIVHPTSAVITGNRLTDKSVLPSWNALKKENENLKLERMNKLNEIPFEGVVTSFQFSYEADLSISATLFLTGVSSTYADLSMLINTPDVITGSLGATYVGSDADKTSVTKITDKIKETTTNSFYVELADEVDDVLNELEDAGINPIGTIDYGLSTGETDDQYIAFARGNPKTKEEEFIRYISLGYLIDFINRQILAKSGTVADAKITCNTNICKSNVYSNLTSADPRDILLPGKSTQSLPIDKQYLPEDSKLDVMVYAKSIQDDPLFVPFMEPGATDEETVAYPSRILISLIAIKKILLRLDPIDVIKKDSKVEAKSGVQIKDFLREVSNKISLETGGAIDMKLIVHPDDASTQTSLLYYDSNYAGTFGDQKSVVPFEVPMFANHPNGTIVREFNLKAKLPNNAKTLAYVLNSDANVSEAQIAPFLQYMYGDRSEEADQQLRDTLQAYAENHFKYLNELEDAKIQLNENSTDDANIQNLRNALKKYLQYPRERISDSSLLGSPQFPYEVDITIDGINGFKYGDVLLFPGVPKRYIKNTVFFITNITHTVDTAGMWTTKISAQMRAKID